MLQKLLEEIRSVEDPSNIDQFNCCWINELIIADQFSELATLLQQFLGILCLLNAANDEEYSDPEKNLGVIDTILKRDYKFSPESSSEWMGLLSCTYNYKSKDSLYLA